MARQTQSAPREKIQIYNITEKFHEVTVVIKFSKQFFLIIFVSTFQALAGRNVTCQPTPAIHIHQYVSTSRGNIQPLQSDIAIFYTVMHPHDDMLSCIFEGFLYPPSN